MKSVPVLRTERLVLRGIEPEDASFIVKLRSDPDVYPFFLNPHKLTEEEHLLWYQNRYLPDENRADWIGVDREGSKVGIFGARRVRSGKREAEINYILARKCYGKGYAGEAIERIMLYCAEEWQARRFVAEIHKENVQSIHFAESHGFTRGKQNGLFYLFTKDI